jgi:hypothetical protein
MRVGRRFHALFVLSFSIPGLVAAQVNVALASLASTDLLSGHGDQARLQTLGDEKFASPADTTPSSKYEI